MSELNVDYILTLKKDDKGMLFIDRVEITHPEDILKELNEFERGDDYDIFDVVSYMGSLKYNERKTYSYCWPHEYNKAFVRNATIRPLFILNNQAVTIEPNVTKWEENYDKEIANIKNRIELEYAQKRNPKQGISERKDYIENKLKERAIK